MTSKAEPQETSEETEADGFEEEVAVTQSADSDAVAEPKPAADLDATAATEAIIDEASPQLPIEPDPTLLAAREIARSALAEITESESIGSDSGHEVHEKYVLSLYFECLLPGYPGWRWVATLSRLENSEEVNVLETELMPGEGAIVSPDWVPWSERLAQYREAQARQAADEASAAENAAAELSDEDEVDPEDDLLDNDFSDFDDEIDGVDFDEEDVEDGDVDEDAFDDDFDDDSEDDDADDNGNSDDDDNGDDEADDDDLDDDDDEDFDDEDDDEDEDLEDEVDADEEDSDDDDSDEEDSDDDSDDDAEDELDDADDFDDDDEEDAAVRANEEE